MRKLRIYSKIIMFNILATIMLVSLLSPIPPVSAPTGGIGTTSTSTGGGRTAFLTSESVYAIGSNFPQGPVNIHITKDLPWIDGMTIPLDVSSDGVNTASANAAGDLGPVLVWPATTTVGEYDIVFDTDQDNKYSVGIDYVNHINHPGFTISGLVTGSAVVGGYYAPVNSLAVLVPYLTLVSLACIVSAILIKGKRCRS